MTRVIVADDQALVREGIRTLLEVAGIEVVAEAEDGAQAVAVIEEHAPEVALMDLRMPRHDGIWALEQLREQGSAVPVLVLTTFDDDALVRSALAAGASGFLLKDTSVEGLTTALHAILDGGMVIDPRVAKAAFRAASSQDEPLAVLTRGERMVAELVARGQTNTEIAETLVLAEGTVKNHVSALLRKLDARDRTALALTLHKALGG